MSKPVVAFLFLLCPLYLFSQPDGLPNANAPKVGLVLSGGGAKGLAHIGVIKVMEELGIRPDFITGTSMGSIVGGLYAAGYSAKELETLVSELDWSVILSDQTQLPNVVLEEKQFYANELLEVPIGKGFKFSFPEAIIQGQQLELELKELTLPVYHINNFDDLHIPFRCIAADIKNAQKVVLSGGDLATAMRASMAIPAFFAPVVMDSMILIDGGVTNNFPVDEIIDLGATVIIGVNVADLNPDDEYLLTPLGQAFEAAMMASNQQFARQRDLCDLFLDIEMDDYSAADFSAADSIMAIGEALARKELNQFKNLIQAYDLELELPNGSSRIPEIQAIRIDSIQVSGNKTFTTKEILGSLNLLEGDYVNTVLLDSSIQRLIGTTWYDKVGYSVSRVEEKNVLDLRVKEKSQAFLKLALLFDNYHKAGVSFNLTARNLFWGRSSFQFLAKISDNYEFDLGYRQYLNSSQNVLLNMSASFHRENLTFFWNGVNLGQTPQFILPLDLELGWRISRNSMIKLGGRYEHRRFSPDGGDLSPFGGVIMNNLVGGVGMEINSLDRLYLPLKGWTMESQIRIVYNMNRSLADVDSIIEDDLNAAFIATTYPSIRAAAQIYVPLGKNERFQLALNPMALFTWVGSNAVVDYFYLGGSESVTDYSLPFAGYQVNRLAVTTAIGLGLDLRYFFNKDFALHWRNSGAAMEFPSEITDGDLFSSLDHFISGTSVGAAYNSFIGPVSIDFNFPLSISGPVERQFSIFFHYGYRF